MLPIRSALPVHDLGTAVVVNLDEAIATVEAMLDSPHLRVDRMRAREDAGYYLVLVFDTAG